MRMRTSAVLLVLFLLSLSASAQERFGGLIGIVTDQTKAAVPGATVSVTNKQSGAVRTAVSAADGSYRFPDLAPGRYLVTVELSGFQKASVDNVLVLLG